MFSLMAMEETIKLWRRHSKQPKAAKYLHTDKIKARRNQQAASNKSTNLNALGNHLLRITICYSVYERHGQDLLLIIDFIGEEAKR